MLSVILCLVINKYILQKKRSFTPKVWFLRGAAIAQWIRLCLPSCRPWFAYHICFNQIRFDLFHVEKTKINKKRPVLAHLKSLVFRWANPASFLFIFGLVIGWHNFTTNKCVKLYWCQHSN